jgi:hypothetical protein
MLEEEVAVVVVLEKRNRSNSSYALTIINCSADSKPAAECGDD